MEPRYIDIHCHPNLGALAPQEDAVIAKMKNEGIGGIVVGVDLKSSQEAVALAEKHDHLWATIGLHPNDTPNEKLDISGFEKLVKSPRVVAIGECGIDYFRIEGDVEVEKKRQWEIFEQQAAFALAHDKPLMIHCRPSKNSMDAYLDMLAFLEGKDLRGDMHFFVGDLAVAERFWAIGFTTSYTGVLTFTHDYDEVVKAAPMDMLMIETDAPWAAPMPYRGQTNYPTYVPLVADAIARIRGEDAETVRAALVANAERVFGLSGAFAG